MDKFGAAGVEVSAKVLVVALQTDGQLRSSEFPNTGSGHKQLIRFLHRYSHRVRVCMESTGLYGLDLALALQGEKGIETMVANPRSVRHFGEAMMKRSKTDPIDAKLLAEYGPTHAFSRLAAAFEGSAAAVCYRPGHPSADRDQHHAEEPPACCWQYRDYAQDHCPGTAAQPGAPGACDQAFAEGS